MFINPHVIPNQNDLLWIQNEILRKMSELYGTLESYAALSSHLCLCLIKKDVLHQDWHHSQQTQPVLTCHVIECYETQPQIRFFFWKIVLICQGF